MTYLLLDLLLAAVLLIFAFRGAAKGFVLSLCGLLAVAVALTGAALASRALSPLVAQTIEPPIAQAIESRLEEEIQAGNGEETLEELPLGQVLDVLREMGLYEQLIDTVDRAVEAGMVSVAAGAAAAVAAALAQSIASAVIFLVAFALLLVVWSLVSRSLDLVARLPGLHFLNKTLGAAVGLLKGCVFLFVAVRLMQYLGHLIPEDLARQTYLLRFFLTFNPLEALI